MTSNANYNSVIIIGAGFAGLAAGTYLQMNGYKTEVFELHDKPGGLCTSWKRNGFTFDGCIHWLVGSNPKSGLNDFWKEMGIAQNRKFINMDEYMRFEGADGRTLIFYTDVDKLEKHLLEFSLRDEKPISEFIAGIRMCIPFDQPSKLDSPLKRILKQLKFVYAFVVKGKKIQKWIKLTADDFANRFQDPILREAFKVIGLPEFSMFFMLFTFAYLHNRNAGYPLGGSRPMSEAFANRYLSLGGLINYKTKVEKIIIEDNRAAGVLLADGTEHRASRVISAADGYNTIFKMLDGKYADNKIREPYEKRPVFQPLIYIGLGVNRLFNDEPLTVSGFSYPLSEPVEIGDAIRNRLSIHIYNQDPSLAPNGKTTIIVMLQSDYGYWKNLAQDESAYKDKKNEIANTIIAQLDKRFPGISSQVETVDVATPLTFERYTGNWQGSFEGWLITPLNAKVIMKPMSQTLPGLQNFYMCGQWVEPGGGLPTSIMSGNRLVKKICKEDLKKFTTIME